MSGQSKGIWGGVTAMALAASMASPAQALHDVYLGEILQVAGTFCPVGWTLADGREIKIVENNSLYTVIGSQYGGDGVRTFALPNLNPPVGENGRRERGHPTMCIATKGVYPARGD